MCEMGVLSGRDGAMTIKLGDFLGEQKEFKVNPINEYYVFEERRVSMRKIHNETALLN